MTEWIVTSSAMILVIIGLRGLLKGKISLRLQYALWAVVLVRLLLPFSIVESAISVSNWLTAPVVREADAAVEEYQQSLDTVWEEFFQSGETPPEQEIEQKVQQELYDRTYERIEQEYAQAGQTVPAVQIETETRKQVERISLTARITQALPYLWVGGMVLMAAVLLISNLHFAWKLRRTRKTVNLPGVPLKVYLTDCVATPCLFGLLRPCIYLTEEIMTDEKMQRHVLTHEMSHYREKDHIWSVLRCVCLVLHWYNPLVWVAAVLSKQDAELSCDERTIRALGEENRAEYGRTLIGMTCVRRDPKALMLTATTMLGTKKALKERIKLIAKKPKAALYTLLACLVVVAVAVGCTFTGAPGETKDPADETMPTEPTTESTTRPTDEPTKPVEVNSEWLNAPLQHLSYQDFFAQERTLTKLTNSRWELGESEKFYAVYHDVYGLYIKPSGRDTSRDGRLHHVPNSEWTRESAYVSYMPTDGRYLYCIRNENEIVRVELLTGEVEVLYSGGEIVGLFAVYKEGVMYFAAREKESAVLYRLYIPERKLDVLYNQIPEDIPYGPWFSLMAPETNWGAIGWKMMNPEMYRYVDAELKNPNSSYAGEDWWTEKFRDWSKHDDIAVSVFIEGILTDFGVKYEIPYRLVCSYDYRNAVYSQREEFAEPPKVTEKHPFTLEGTHLTRKELDWFQNVFFTYTDTDASGKATFNIRNMFLRAEFKKPEEINLGLVFSMGVTRHSEVSQKEKDLYDQATNNDMELDYFKTPRKDLEQLFYENTGITVDQSQKIGLDKLVYLKEYDAYYTIGGSSAYTYWNMREGVRMEDGTIVLLYSDRLGTNNPICKVTLVPRGDSYIIVANDRQGKS